MKFSGGITKFVSTNLFSSGQVFLGLSDPLIAIRVGINTYSFSTNNIPFRIENTDQIIDHYNETGTITFTTQGYVDDFKDTYVINGICTGHFIYTLSDLRLTNLSRLPHSTGLAHRVAASLICAESPFLFRVQSCGMAGHPSI